MSDEIDMLKERKLDRLATETHTHAISDNVHKAIKDLHLVVFSITTLTSLSINI